MKSSIRSRVSGPSGFTMIEAVLTIAIIGIMASLVVTAITNASKDAYRVIGRQQQQAVQNALNAWVMGSMRVGDTAQVQGIDDLRDYYNGLGATSARFQLLIPNPSASSVRERAGYLDDATAEHFQAYTVNTSALKTAALEATKQHLELPDWGAGEFPKVQMVND